MTAWPGSASAWRRSATAAAQLAPPSAGRTSELTVETHLLTEEEEAVETQAVVNWHEPTSVDGFEAWIDDRQRSEIGSGQELLDQAADVLPRLDYARLPRPDHCAHRQ